jgi:microcystin degradation protein MlrC
MRVAIVGIQHESNTFAAEPTTMPMFESGRTYAGADIRPNVINSNHEVAGFFEVLEASDVEPVPIYFALTLPSGTITRDTCETLVKNVMDGLEAAGPLDGILAAPHGAGCGEGNEFRDFDGHWLGRVREFLGNDKPIITTIDPHCNLSERMVAASDAIVAYRTNPHIDQKAIGIEAGKLMLRTLAGEIKPVTAASYPPAVINIERQKTSAAPCRPMYEVADAMLEQPGVLSNSIVLGFPYADTEEMGSAFITVTDNTPEQAQTLADELADYLVAHREDFKGHFINIPTAIDDAISGAGPVCLLDMGDNVGGGSPADSTFIAHELHRRADTIAFICLNDPDAQAAARKAGVGASVALEMGGKVDDAHGTPLAATVTVVSLHDGDFQDQAVRHGGQTVYKMGQTAIVRTDTGLTICLSSRRTVPFSIKQLTSCDIDPAHFQILVAKGVQAPAAAYEPVCNRLIRVATAGCTAADMCKFEFKHRRKPQYPFEEI